MLVVHLVVCQVAKTSKTNQLTNQEAEDVPKKGPKIGPKRMTRYEKSRVVGARALQISMGAPILTRIDANLHDPIRIAELELLKRVLPITIRRKLPSGAFEDVALVDLLD